MQRIHTAQSTNMFRGLIDAVKSAEENESEDEVSDEDVVEREGSSS